VVKIDLSYLLKVFYLLLPGYFANMSPAFSNKINFLNYPVDFNKTLFGKRILGKNKTFRGIFFAILIAIVISYLQSLLDLEINLISYDTFIWIGFLLGFGAMFGDLIKSFFKRQLNIPPGKRFLPFDQIDHVIGALIFLSIDYNINIKIFIVGLIITFPLHLIINYVTYKLKLRDTYW